MSVSSAGSPRRLIKDSQQTVEYKDPATLKEMSPDRNSSAGLSELADEVCDSAAKMLGRKREKAAGSPGILKKFKIDLNSKLEKYRELNKNIEEMSKYMSLLKKNYRKSQAEFS